MSDDQPAAARSATDEQKVISGGPTGVHSRADREQRRASREFKQAQAKSRLTMHVKVYSPFRDYYDGEAFSVSAENATGPFDILPRHHNFISLLSRCDIVIRTAQDSEQKIVISGGIMHVKADQVIVFLDV